MKLTGIKISGYRSIDELEFQVKKYGKDINESYTTILIGKNETGKSNVLNALAIPQNKDTVSFNKIKNQDKEPKVVFVRFNFKVEADDDYRGAISEAIDIPSELVRSLNITDIQKEMRLRNGVDKYYTDNNYEANIPPSVTEYSFAQYKKTPANAYMQVQPKISTTIKKTNELTDSEKSAYSPLTNDNFREIIKSALSDFTNSINMPVDYWIYDKKYLIEGKIDLRDFSENPSTNIPLKNMFYLAGCKDKEEIKDKVNEIAETDNRRKKLAKKLSTATTKYLNDRWKEHKISIEVEIESSTLNLSVSVRDEANEDSYFDMDERSQGFKQFTSLLLSISISSASGDTKNHLIVIDEPEIHLHPSGVRWMLKELIEIGKNNYLFISTHSNFMLDKTTKERHYLLTRGEDGLTVAHHITSEEDINDDELLQSAFGINIITESLPQHRLLVEGQTDKKILQSAFERINDKHDAIAIFNGTGANTIAVASYLLNANVSPLVVVDDDGAGKRAKERINEINKTFGENTYTIRDLSGSIISGGSIEDALPKDFVESKARTVLEAHDITGGFSLDDLTPYCKQITAFYSQKTSRNSKVTQDEKKAELKAIMIDIKTEIAEYSPTKNFAKDAPKLYTLAQEILNRLQ